MLIWNSLKWAHLESETKFLPRISFDISQPVTWELHLAGESTIALPIEWSIDAEASNFDEPSSFSNDEQLHSSVAPPKVD